MIKTVLTAAAAFALTAGVAFAQPTINTATGLAPTTAKPGPTTDMPKATAMPQGQADGGARSTSTSSASMPMTPTMTANMPMGDAPTAYPFCTKKGQDRCKQRRAM